ncbi:diguanylate cyclase [Frateuria aurantia]
MRYLLVCSWLILLALSVVRPAIAQSLSDASLPLLRDYAIDHWTTRDGLPHNAIRSIAQTPDKHLWFGTWEGLVSYNGLDFTVYDRSSRPPLLDNGIGAVYVDPRGALWMSDSRGNISCLQAGGQWRFWPAPAGTAQMLVQSMQMDRRGRLWLLYEGNGLGYLDSAGHLHYQRPAPGSPLATVYSHMVITPDGRVWAGSYDGLVYLDPDGSAHRLQTGAGLQHGLVWPYLAPDGTMWVVAGDRLYRMHSDGPELIYTLSGAGQITALLQDRQSSLWVGTENQGMLRIHGHQIEALHRNASLSAGRIVSLLEDAEGSIWIGSNGGLFRLRHTLFSNYTQHDGLSNNYVRAVFEDHRGRLWIGHAGGLDMVEGVGHIHPVSLATSTGAQPEVYSLDEDAQGTIWVGTFHDGVYAIDPQWNIRHFGTQEGLPAGNVRAISVGPDGRVWVGTQRGVVWIAGSQIHRPQVPGLPDGLVTALHSSTDGVWIGTLQGAWWLHGQQLQRIKLDTPGGGRTVFGFVTRPDGTTWISSDRGLYRYRAGQLRRVGLEHGLPVDSVFQWVEDHLGNVWINSNRGLLRTRLADLNAAIDQGTPIHPERYDEMNGMASSQGNGSSSPDIILRRDGTIALATAGGVAMVDPARLPAERALPPPPVIIEKLELNGINRRLPGPGQVLRISGHRQLAVTYVGLSYLLSERIEYRTRLDGLDGQWVDRGHQHSVEYIGLPPGDYVLHVSAAHPDGPWSTHEAVLRFTILPLWWQRTSVRLACGLLLIVVALIIYRFMVNQYKRSNARLAREVAERTRDLQLQAEQLLAANHEKSLLLTQLQLQSESFERQAREDALTGLPNRRAFDELLTRDVERMRRHGSPLCLVMLDIDHFKAVNDQHSHQTGDAVLREVGRLLRRECRVSDVAARLGGEEFAIILSSATIDDARRLLQRLRDAFRQNSGWLGIADLNITFSAGVAQMSPDRMDCDDLLRRADEALYRAKHGGRDRVCEG